MTATTSAPLTGRTAAVGSVVVGFELDEASRMRGDNAATR